MTYLICRICGKLRIVPSEHNAVGEVIVRAKTLSIARQLLKLVKGDEVWQAKQRSR